MVSPSARRRAVKMSVQEGLGQVAAACRALGVSRSSYYRRGRSSLESRRIRKEVLELSEKHPRYGYRRITALMRREGFEVNGKRVARIRREDGIKVSKKQRRLRRLGISTTERQRAERPGQVWSWDFVAGRASRKSTNCLKDHGQSRSKADEDQAQSLPFPFFLSPLPPLPLCS